MLFASSADLEARARVLMDRLDKRATHDLTFAVEKDRVPVGGGSVPALELDTWVIAIRGANDRSSADQIARKLRKARIPVLSRVREGAVSL